MQRGLLRLWLTRSILQVPDRAGLRQDALRPGVVHHARVALGCHVENALLGGRPGRRGHGFFGHGSLRPPTGAVVPRVSAGPQSLTGLLHWVLSMAFILPQRCTRVSGRQWLAV